MKKECLLSQSIVAKVILALWIAFSFIYIVTDIWQNFKQNELLRVVNQAQSEIVSQLILEAEKCEPFPVFVGETKVELIKVGCEQ